MHTYEPDEFGPDIRVFQHPEPRPGIAEAVRSARHTVDSGAEAVRPAGKYTPAPEPEIPSKRPAVRPAGGPCQRKGREKGS